MDDEMASTLYTVRCCAFVEASKAHCGTGYVCGKKAFHAQTNACPECGSNKAQWVAPARNLKKDEEEK